MKIAAARTAVLLVGVVALLLAWTLAGASNGGNEATGPAGQEQGDSQRREQGLSAPPGATVHDIGDERPAADYPFSDPKQYWPLNVYTSSEAVRQLVASQALPGPPYGAVYFVAWVPEPLIPSLEQRSDVYRLAWNGDWRPDLSRGVPVDIIVTTLGSSRPPQGYPFSDPKHYRGVYVFTKSRPLRELVASQALPREAGAGMVYGGTLLGLSDSGFAAWVPEPLIPVLEQHPDVERLEWDVMKMPLIFFA